MQNRNIQDSAESIHKVACDLDQVINVLMYAERDPNTGHEPSCLIKASINQLKLTLKILNDEYGTEWPENQ